MPLTRIKRLCAGPCGRRTGGTQIRASWGARYIQPMYMVQLYVCAGCTCTGTVYWYWYWVLVLLLLLLLSKLQLTFHSAISELHDTESSTRTSFPQLLAAAFKSLASFSRSFFCAFLWVCCCSTKHFLPLLLQLHSFWRRFYISYI